MSENNLYPKRSKDITTVNQLPVIRNTRTSSIKLRVTPQEKEDWELLALECGYANLSDALRAGIQLLQERVRGEAQ